MAPELRTPNRSPASPSTNNRPPDAPNLFIIGAVPRAPHAPADVEAGILQEQLSLAIAKEAQEILGDPAA